MSTVLVYAKIGENPVFPAGSAEVIDKDDRISMIDALIFNRDELVSPDMDESLSDASLLLLLMQREGWEVLKRVNGDFAGAVYEKSTGIWTLFRDHLGVRPLYCYADGNLFVTATDMRDIARTTDVHLTIDERQLWLKLAGYNGSSLRDTEFGNIRCVCPGSVTEFVPSVNGFEMKETRYFKPGMNRITMNSDEEYIAEMRRLVEDSIRRRMKVIEGTAGAELSGGLDSCVIDILINRMGKPLKCISWRIVPDDWPLQDVDERRVIRDVCEQEGIECVFTPEDSWRKEEDYDSFVPPFDNTQSLGTVAEILSEKGIRYIFSGQGGDEGVSHRSNVLELWRAREYGYFFRELWFHAKRKRLKVLRFVYLFMRCMFAYYFRTVKPFHTDCNMLPFLADTFKRKMKDVKGEPFLFPVDPVGAFEYGGIRMRPETAAYQAEKFGVQFLYPYEDYRVFDFALSIPRHLFIREGKDRWIYRMAFDDIMPQSLREVDFKDAPSLRQYKNDNGNSTGMEEILKSKILDRLDRKLWADYIDFDSLEQFKVPDNTDDNEEMLICFIIEKMRSILLIQRMIEEKEQK